MQLKPMHDNVLILKEKVDEKVTGSGIILVDLARDGTAKHKRPTGRVTAVGPGRHSRKKICPVCGDTADKIDATLRTTHTVDDASEYICKSTRFHGGCDWDGLESDLVTEEGRIPMTLKEGDRVIVEKWKGHPIVIDDVEYWVYPEDEIMAIIDEEVEVDGA